MKHYFAIFSILVVVILAFVDATTRLNELEDLSNKNSQQIEILKESNFSKCKTFKTKYSTNKINKISTSNEIKDRK